ESIPGLTLKELPESMWCCGSAGIYNITQPETSAELKARKVKNILSTRADTVATANPGCHLQLQHGLKQADCSARVVHPISLLAEAYRREDREG
ncbi:MAG TPA: (Fe-S)-binding protein, partial [Terrimicrobiaceae bacterium]|nr:(Fe-S)-binding protein [Terrimicrobiaceae bacterium]